MSKVVGTLSTDGWVTSIDGKADNLLAYYFTTDPSQSELYAGQVQSIQGHIQQYGNDSMKLQSRVQDYLRQYLERHFDGADVQVTVEDISDEDQRLNLILNCTVVENGTTYSLGRLVKTMNAKVIEIVNIING